MTESTVVTLEACIPELEARPNESETEILRLRAANADLTSKLEKAEKELEQLPHLRRRVSDQKAELNDLIQDHSTIEADLVAKLFATQEEAKQVPHLNTRVAELKEQCRRMEQFAKSDVARINELRNDVRVLHDRLGKEMATSEARGEATRVIIGYLMAAKDSPSISDVFDAIPALERVVPDHRLGDEALKALGMMMGESAPITAEIRVRLALDYRTKKAQVDQMAKEHGMAFDLMAYLMNPSATTARSRRD